MPIEGIVIRNLAPHVIIENCRQLARLIVRAVAQVTLPRIFVDSACQLDEVAARPTKSPRTANSHFAEPPASGFASPPRQKICGPRELSGQVAGVTSKYLVAAHAAKDDGESFAGGRTYQIGRNCGRV